MNMNQMQAFIAKARNDITLISKLDKLGVSGAGEEKIVALAAEHGFSITAEDYQSACESAEAMKSGELAEEDLDVVSGGATQNRYDPKECCKIDTVAYRCVGFLAGCWCDHYERTFHDLVGLTEEYRHVCKMGSFDYIGYTHGNVK